MKPSGKLWIARGCAIKLQVFLVFLHSNLEEDRICQYAEISLKQSHISLKVYVLSFWGYRNGLFENRVPQNPIISPWPQKMDKRCRCQLWIRRTSARPLWRVSPVTMGVQRFNHPKGIDTQQLWNRVAQHHGLADRTKDSKFRVGESASDFVCVWNMHFFVGCRLGRHQNPEDEPVNTGNVCW